MQHKKFKPNEGFGTFSVLLHGIGLLDKAAKIAVERQDFNGILEVFDRMLEANDRVMTFASVEREDDNGGIDEPDVQSTKGRGFYP